MKFIQKSCTNYRLGFIVHRMISLSTNTAPQELQENRFQGCIICRRCYSSLYRTWNLPVFYNSPGFRINMDPNHHSSPGLIMQNPPQSTCRLLASQQLKSTNLHNSYSRPMHYLAPYSSVVLDAGTPPLSQHNEARGLTGAGRHRVGLGIDNVVNPIERLQQHVVVPLIPEKDYKFRPTAEDVAAAHDLFVPGHKHDIHFLKSALFDEHLPDYDLPEVAFIGRSNVGKSSLIGMLLSDTDVLVKISKKPGHTQLLNFFQVGNAFTLVDMPGYGFNMPEHYASSVEKFLSSRKKLIRTFILVDSAVGVTKNDVIGLNMLEEFHIPYVMTLLVIDGRGPNSVDAKRFEMINAMNIDYCIVMTKIDKAKPSTLLKSFMTVLTYNKKTNHCFSQPFLVSSVSGEGIPLLQAFIAYVTGNIHVHGM